MKSKNFKVKSNKETVEQAAPNLYLEMLNKTLVQLVKENQSHASNLEKVSELLRKVHSFVEEGEARAVCSAALGINSIISSLRNEKRSSVFDFDGLTGL